MTDSPDESEDWFGTGEPAAASGIVGEYFALRREAEADVLAMQMGDFYEFFGEDTSTVDESGQSSSALYAPPRRSIVYMSRTRSS